MRRQVRDASGNLWRAVIYAVIAAWQGGLPVGCPAAPTAAEPPRSLSLSSFKEVYDRLEPLVVDVRVRNNTANPLVLEGPLLPERSEMTIDVSLPSGRSRPYSFGDDLINPPPHFTVDPYSSVMRRIAIFGMNAEPGEYRLRAVARPIGQPEFAQLRSSWVRVTVVAQDPHGVPAARLLEQDEYLFNLMVAALLSGPSKSDIYPPLAGAMRRVMTEHPASPHAPYCVHVLAAHLHACGRHKEAIELVNLLEQRYPEFPLTLEARHLRGLAKIDAGDVSAGQRELRAIREANPEAWFPIDSRRPSGARPAGLAPADFSGEKRDKLPDKPRTPGIR